MGLLSRFRNNEPDYNPSKYPKWDNVEEKTVETTFKTHQYKITYKDGETEVMEAEKMSKKEDEIAFSFIKGFKAHYSKAKEGHKVSPRHESKRWRARNEIKGREIIGEEERTLKATIKTGDKTYLQNQLSNYEETKERTRKAVKEELSWEVKQP